MTLYDRPFKSLNTFSIRYPVLADGKHRVIPVPSHPAERIKGRAFFPGGSGHSEGESAPLPANPILTLGNNFGCWGYYTQCVRRGEEPLDNRTWRYLLEIYKQVGLDHRCCFHSNVYMGFIPDDSHSEKMVITNEFHQDCVTFLVFQIETINPKAIVALGSKVQGALADVSPEVRTSWNGKSYDLYRSNSLLLQNVSIPIGQRKWYGDVITIMHPSRRKGNLGKIRKRFGIDAESIELKSLRNFVSRNP